MNITAALEVFVVRHGETEWSLSGQHTGRTDIALTARGENQARALAPVLRATPFAQVFASPRQRARRTCELAGCGAVMEIDPELAEWDYGDYEALNSVDIRRNRPGWSVWDDGCPGGESPQQVGERADRLIARLRTFEGRIALFSHGQFGRVLAMRWVGWPVGAGRHLRFDPAGFGILGHEDGNEEVPVISRWNASPAAWALPD